MPSLKYYASIIVCITFTHDIKITIQCYTFNYTVICILKKLGKINILINIIFPFLVLYSSKDPSFHLASFPFSLWNSLSISCSASLLATKSHFHLCHVILSSKCWLFSFFLLWSFSSAFREPTAVSLYFVQNLSNTIFLQED